MAAWPPAVRHPPAPAPASKESPGARALAGLTAFSGGLGLGLLPLLLGLPLLAWGQGFLQAFGGVVVAAAPACALLTAVTLEANAAPQWRWRGALVGCLLAALLDALLLGRVFSAL